MSVFHEIGQIITDTCDGIEQESIKPETNLIEELNIDSLDFLDITYEIDRKYQIKLPVEDWIVEINDGKATLEDYFVMSRIVERVEQLIAEA